MANYYGNFSGRSGYRLRLVVTYGAYSIAGNSTPVSWWLYADQTSGSDTWSLSPNGSRSTNIGGHTWSAGGWSYDFRSASSFLIGSGSETIVHNANGSKTISVSGYANSGSTLGSASASGSLTLPTIPRASTPALSPATLDAGETMSIATNRASSDFTHTASWAFGSLSGVIEEDVATSTSWSPPLELLEQIPNAASGIGNITLQTYSGATLIGSKSSPFTLKAPVDVLPTFAGITHAENVALVASEIGGYVQALSKLDLAITSPAGVYGSTITSQKLTVGAQVINAGSGTTGVLQVSGTVPITGTVTDSRGRSYSASVDVEVLPYSLPAIDLVALNVRRANLSGDVEEEGTRIRVDLTAAVASLVVGGVEKNALTHKVFSRLRGESSWVLKEDTTLAGVTIGPPDFLLVGTYPVDESHEVLIQVLDKFNVAQVIRLIATATVLMHWSPTGVAINKFHEFGDFDVKGEGYHRDGKLLLDVESGAPLAHTHDAAAIDAGILDRARGGTGVEAADLTALKAALGIPFAYASGVVAAPASSTSAGGGNTFSNLSITFPVGRFTEVPIITLGATAGSGRVATAGFQAPNATVEGVAARVICFNNTVVAGAELHWTATQMHESEAEG